MLQLASASYWVSSVLVFLMREKSFVRRVHVVSCFCINLHAVLVFVKLASVYA